MQHSLTRDNKARHFVPNQLDWSEGIVDVVLSGYDHRYDEHPVWRVGVFSCVGVPASSLGSVFCLTAEVLATATVALAVFIAGTFVVAGTHAVGGQDLALRVSVACAVAQAGAVVVAAFAGTLGAAAIIVF